MKEGRLSRLVRERRVRRAESLRFAQDAVQVLGAPGADGVGPERLGQIQSSGAAHPPSF